MAELFYLRHCHIAVSKRTRAENDEIGWQRVWAREMRTYDNWSVN